ncbi:MAG: type II toxin-antitoxin system Phd/YefM family antitoxin [Candidatus Levybacteria bacterium]|nr:type II toxin-antitoxin system Phd/YefM family antitoxin [Candidatus Levybacteria bacterium]
MTQTLPVTKAREELTQIVDNAKNKLDEYIITVNGVPAAVIMSHAEFESWKETTEILSDPSLMKAIRQGEKDEALGKVHDWEDVKKELGLHVAAKTNHKGKKRA